MITRFVVWSPRATACMSCATRDKAERLMDFWRGTRLLGCDDWRITRVGDAQAAEPHRPAAARRSRRPHAANDALAGQAGDDPMRLLATRLAAQEALVAELRRQLNDRILTSVREATSQQRRIGELEAQLAALRHGRVRGAGQATG